MGSKMNQWCDAVAKRKKKDFIQEYVGRHVVCQTVCTTVLSNGRDLLAVCCISRFKVEKLECRGECLGNKGFRKKWRLLFCFADRRLGPIPVVWKKLAVRRMVPADSMHPLGIRQEVFGEHAAETFLCQEELISQTRQLFKVVMVSFPLEIFKNRAEKYLPEMLRCIFPRLGTLFVAFFLHMCLFSSKSGKNLQESSWHS